MKNKLQTVFPYLLVLLAACWLYSLSVIIDRYWLKYASYESLTANYQEGLKEKEETFFEFVSEEQQLLQQISNGRYSLEQTQTIEEQPFYLFLYKSNQLNARPFYWSTNQVEPPQWVPQVAETGKLLRYGNGYYEVLRKRIQLDNTDIEVVGLILLYREYFIDNARLHKGFPGFKPMDGRLLFSVTPTAYEVVNVKNEPLFYLQPALNEPLKYFSVATLLVQLITMGMLIMLVSRIASAIIQQDKALLGFSFFAACFVGLWYSIRYTGIPINLDQFSWLEKSETLSLPPAGLLELLQNSLFVFWLGIFLTLQSQKVGQLLTGLNYKLKALIAVILVAATIAKIGRAHV